MIPKIIHYCWLSNDPIPSNIQHYMDSWKKYLPDYEFIHWNFDKFDKSSSRWVSEAFDNKKYAFAADYIRLYALYHYGGIYLDMDVEVLKSFNPFLSLQTMYNPQIQISAESGTKRSNFRQKDKTKRSKKRLHTTLIKPEQKVNEDLCSGFIVS